MTPELRTSSIKKFLLSSRHRCSGRTGEIHILILYQNVDTAKPEATPQTTARDLLSARNAPGHTELL